VAWGSVDDAAIAEAAADSLSVALIRRRQEPTQPLAWSGQRIHYAILQQHRR